MTQIVNIEITKYPDDVMKELPRNLFKTDYALVFFSDMDTVTKALANAARIKMMGFMIGTINANEVKYLNLRKSDPGPPEVALLNRVLEFIYVTHKLSMFDYCLGFIDNFLRYINTTMQGKFELNLKGTFIFIEDNLVQLMKFIPKSDFKPENFLNVSYSSAPEEIIHLSQMLFWFKIINLIKLGQEMKIMEAYVKFVASYFKPFTMKNIDSKTDLVVKSIWKINFVNENYKSIEAYCKTSSDKSQHWMVVLLGMLQDSYYEIAKTYSKTNSRKYETLWENLSQLIKEDDESYYNESNPVDSFGVDIRALYDKNESFIMSALSNCTTNLLNHVFFRTHPRAFLAKYITSLHLHLSLKSQFALETVSSWIDKVNDRLNLSFPFLELFKILSIYKAMYYVKMNQFENAVLTLLELLNKRYKEAEDGKDHKIAQEFIMLLSSKLTGPIGKPFEKLLSIDNGVVTIDE